MPSARPSDLAMTTFITWPVSLGDEAPVSAIAVATIASSSSSPSSAGMYPEIVATTGVVNGIRQLADDLLHQYVITYTMPDSLKPNERLLAQMLGMDAGGPRR